MLISYLRKFVHSYLLYVLFKCNVKFKDFLSRFARFRDLVPLLMITVMSCLMFMRTENLGFASLFGV